MVEGKKVGWDKRMTCLPIKDNFLWGWTGTTLNLVGNLVKVRRQGWMVI
jgi:hypothetical protein